MRGFFDFVSENKRVQRLMRACSISSTVCSAVAFVYLLWYFASDSAISALKYLIILGVPFVTVSIVRRLINAPRPYEFSDFQGDAPRSDGGNSFPSRHAFSAFAIGSLALFVNSLLGIGLLMLAILMCIGRVALRIHFIRDVACGALIGVFSSVIGALILL
jgi:membrane-associated phospholipid phosphatase